MEYGKSFWNEACLCGTITGCVCAMFSVGKSLLAMGGSPSAGALAAAFAGTAAFAVMIYVFVRRRAAGCGGMTFGQCVGFVAAMMIFAGAVEGIAAFVVQNFVMKEFYEELISSTVAQMEEALAALPDGEALLTRIYRSLLFSPLGCIATGIINDVVCGTLCGVIVAAFVSRGSGGASQQDKNHTADDDNE